MNYKAYTLLFAILVLQACGDNTMGELPSAPLTSANSVHNGITYKSLTFKNLNYFKILKENPNDLFANENDELIDRQVPKEVKDLNDQNVELTGYAYPIKLVEGKTSILVLMAVNPKCCFGDVLKLNDMIYVDISKDVKKIKNGQCVHMRGKINVGMRDVTAWNSKFLYVMTADQVVIENKSK